MNHNMRTIDDLMPSDCDYCEHYDTRKIAFNKGIDNPSVCNGCVDKERGKRERERLEKLDREFMRTLERMVYKDGDDVERLRKELEQAERRAAEEERRRQMREAAQVTKDFIDSMTVAGIPEEKAWKMLLTMLKNQ